MKIFKVEIEFVEMQYSTDHFIVFANGQEVDVRLVRYHGGECRLYDNGIRIGTFASLEESRGWLSANC